MPVLHEITSDGRTVWVNGSDGLLGRFGPNGIDVHQPMSVQVQRGNECLHCTHEKTTLDDWHVFVAKMKEHFDIDVPAEHMPKALTKEAIKRGEVIILNLTV